MNRLQFATLVLILSSQAWADTSPYYFGVSCASQGSMTADALTATQEIRKYAHQIQNDPNCTNVARELYEAFDRLDKEGLSFLQKEQEPAVKLSQMSQEVQSLRSMPTTDKSLASEIVRLLLNRHQKMAKLISKVSVDGAITTANEDRFSADSSEEKGLASQLYGGKSLMTYSQKVSVAIHSGMNILNDVIGQLPSSKECLKDPTATSQVFSGIVKTLAVFAGSGQTGMGSTFARTISEFGRVLRDNDFADAYRKLNKQEFMASLSCLVEVTEESYCSVRDNVSLLEEQRKADEGDLPEGISDEDLRQFRGGIFEGFYVLSQHIPTITDWIQKVQFGVDPKTPNDADFKDNILDEVNHYFKTLNRVEGALSKELENIRNAPDVNSQKVQALNLVLTLEGKLGSAHSQPTTGSTATHQNFFENNVPGPRLVWFLLGMENVNPPDKCVTKPAANKPSMPMHCHDWLKTYYNEEPAFNAPLELIDTIKHQFKKLKQMANRTLISYYNRWFIVDRPNLVGESMTSATYSIPQSLESVDLYLTHLTERIQKLSPQIYGSCKDNCPVSFSDSKNMIPIIQDTQRKIRSILAEYGKLSKNIQSQLPSVADYEAMTAEEKRAMIEKDIRFEKDYTNIVEEVYDRLMVMLARTGFLSNRLQTFIYHDISLVLKSKTQFSDYQKYFYYQTGKMILEKIKKMYGENLGAARADMNQALTIHLGNIESLEGLFKDNFIAMIAESKMISEGRITNWVNTNIDSTQRLFTDTTDARPDRNGNYGFFEPWGSLLFASIGGVLLNSQIHSDRYPTKSPFIINDSNSPDTEFHSQEEVYSRLCLLSLGFNDWKPFHRLCAGSELQSPVSRNRGMGNLKIPQEQLSMKYYNQLVSHWKDKPLNHSIRICSYRDYLRRNLVAYLIKDLDQEERLKRIQETDQMTKHKYEDLGPIEQEQEQPSQNVNGSASSLQKVVPPPAPEHLLMPQLSPAPNQPLPYPEPSVARPPR